jgi:hypothetical protein
LSDVGSYARVQRMLWFDWLSPLYGLYQCGTETGTGAPVLSCVLINPGTRIKRFRCPL